MSKLIPEAGMLFYAEPTWHLNETTIQGGMLVSSKTEIKDRSYSEKVMRCIAADARSVVAEIVWGASYGNDPRMFKISEYEFQPVDPEVAAALGLAQSNEQRKTKISGEVR